MQRVSPQMNTDQTRIKRLAIHFICENLCSSVAVLTASNRLSHHSDYFQTEVDMRIVLEARMFQFQSLFEAGCMNSMVVPSGSRT